MKKYWQYLSYVIIHKWNVYKAGRMIGVPFIRGLLHDWSKFLPDEFIPYANYFYGTGARPYFDLGWKKHQRRNDHHWQHWLLVGDSDGMTALPMPRDAIREMVADWASFAIKTKDRKALTKWWEANEKNIILDPDARLSAAMLVAIMRQRMKEHGI